MPWFKINNGEVFVDDEDAYLIDEYTWRISPYGYAVRSYRKGDKITTMLMHRQITNCPDGMIVDHKDGDRNNNARANLRVCTQNENTKNVTALGVVFDASRGKYRAQMLHNGKQITIGRYDTVVEAHEAYKKRKRELCGEFARLT